mgnify:CR=1 FL=1
MFGRALGIAMLYIDSVSGPQHRCPSMPHELLATYVPANSGDLLY